MFGIDSLRYSESEVDAIGRRHRSLTTKLQRAMAAVEDETRKRRVLLTEGEEPDPRALGKADQTCAAAAARKEALEDACGVLASQLQEAQNKLANARQSQERERVASELERRAVTIEKAAEGLRTAMGGVRSHYDVLLAAVRELAFLTPRHGPGMPSSPIAETNAILLAEVRGIAPDLAPWSEYMGAAPLDAREVAKEALGRPLRQLAAQVRSGEAPAILPEKAALLPAKIDIPETMLALSESISYVSADGRRVLISEGGVTLPVPVAEKAIACGVAHPLESAAGREILRDLAKPERGGLRRPENYVARVRRGPPYRDLGANLYDYVQNERAKLSGHVAAA